MVRPLCASLTDHHDAWCCLVLREAHKHAGEPREKEREPVFAPRSGWSVHTPQRMMNRNCSTEKLTEPN